MGNAIKFKHTNVPRHPGERARLKVVQGADFGSIYVITGTVASIGRGEENDIVLTDLKTSRMHAVMVLAPSGRWRVKDQGSANGILFNGQATKESEIQFNDIVTLGETLLEFVSADLGTQVLMSPARSSSEVLAEQKMFQEARDRAGPSSGKSMAGNSPSLGPGDGAAAKAARNKKIGIYLIGALGLGLLLLGDPDKPKVKRSSKEGDIGQDLASFLPAPDFNQAAETLFKDGLREYFVHNYGRARTQFETVLQISPGHILATLYLENCNKAVEDEVKVNLEGGKKSFEAGKFRDAKGHFETVLRLLYRDQTNPAYIEARDQFDKLVKEIKGEVAKK